LEISKITAGFGKMQKGMKKFEGIPLKIEIGIDNGGIFNVSVKSSAGIYTMDLKKEEHLRKINE
jgi:hypothetical protein